MRLSIILLSCIAFAAAEVLYKTQMQYADKDFLQKQKFLLEVLRNIHQPLQFEEYEKDTHMVEGESYYMNYTKVEEFMHAYQRGVLPQNHVFSIFNNKHAEEAKVLFHIFYQAKDWNTFKQNVLWARQHMNEGIFVYSLTAAILHRSDTKGLVLPAPYEICPYLFHTGQVIRDAVSYKMQDLHKVNTLHVIMSNYTSDYQVMNEEGKLAYFTEDIGLNSYYYYFNLDYPFWLGGKEHTLSHDRRGEQYLYMHQQLLARYYLERLSNDLGEIPELSWAVPIKTGYDSQLRYYNGVGFTVRKNYYEVYSTHDYHTLNMIDDYERRIRDVIDRGVYGKNIELTEKDGVDILGNLIQSNPDSVDQIYFGQLIRLAHKVLGGGNNEHTNIYKLSPSVLEHYETTMRDPVFYQFYKRIIGYYYQYKNHLTPYSNNDLIYHGVKITNVEIGKLVTYFDTFESDITTSVDLSIQQNDDVTKSKKYHKGISGDYVIKAKQVRLNHKPFTMSIDITSDKAQDAVIRIYMAPKYDQYGHEYTVNENRENIVELDQFVYTLPVGKVTIKRNSKDLIYSIKDRTTYSELYKQVMMAIEGNTQFVIDNSETHCGFPDRLILPKGWVEGMPVVFYVVVTPHIENHIKQYSTYDHNISCGVGSGSRFIDVLPFGYPFDRQIEDNEFHVPNIYTKDILVYHKADTDYSRGLH